MGKSQILERKAKSYNLNLKGLGQEILGRGCGFKLEMREN
jgi:hypothetical protein